MVAEQGLLTREAINVFGAASCGHPDWNCAGAADANESTATRATRELKEEFFSIPECAY